MKKQNNKTAKRKIVFLYIIIAVLVIALGAVLFNQYQTQKLTNAIKIGYEKGFTDAVLGVIDSSRNCQYVDLTFGNQTYQLVDIECLS